MNGIEERENGMDGMNAMGDVDNEPLPGADVDLTYPVHPVDPVNPIHPVTLLRRPISQEPG
jgi:hypothetical protein